MNAENFSLPLTPGGTDMSVSPLPIPHDPLGDLSIYIRANDASGLRYMLLKESIDASSLVLAVRTLLMPLVY